MHTYNAIKHRSEYLMIVVMDDDFFFNNFIWLYLVSVVAHRDPQSLP